MSIRTGAVVALIVAVIATVVVIRAGGEDDAPPAEPRAAATPAPTPGNAGDTAIIRAWADSLRGGRVAKASGYFALPSTVANGAPPVTLAARGEVRQFNQSLPCGARLVRTVARKRYTIGVFVLTDRPGGDCGPGTGHQAATAFYIHDGQIVEWVRVAVPPPSEQPSPRAPAPEPGAPAPRGPRGPAETS